MQDQAASVSQIISQVGRLDGRTSFLMEGTKYVGFWEVDTLATRAVEKSIKKLSPWEEYAKMASHKARGPGSVKFAS